MVSEDGKLWDVPGGRPEGDEDWRQTLDREVLEEACASVDAATLIGFSRGVCIEGHEAGLVLVRSLWRAEVTLNPWRPQHEMSHRLVTTPEDALERITLAGLGHPGIYERWLSEALGR